MWIFLPAIPLWLVSLWLFFYAWLCNLRAFAWYDEMKKRAASSQEQPAFTSDISIEERHDYEGRLDQLQRWLNEAREELEEKRDLMADATKKIRQLEELLKRSAAGNVIDISDVG